MTTPLTKDELTDLRNWADGEFSDPRPTREMVRRVLGMLDDANADFGAEGRLHLSSERELESKVAELTARAEAAEQLVIDTGKDRDDAHAAWSALSVASDETRKQIRELQAIVDRCHTTKDGVIIHGWMELWLVTDGEPKQGRAVMNTPTWGNTCYDATKCYSTREAALAAQKESAK
jgi:hypothetical protein